MNKGKIIILGQRFLFLCGLVFNFFGGKDEGQRNLFTVIQVRFINLVIIVTLKDPTRLRMLPFRFLFYSHRLCLWLTAHSAAAELPTTHAHTAPWPMDHFEVKRLEGQLPLRWSFFFFFLFFSSPSTAVGLGGPPNALWSLVWMGLGSLPLVDSGNWGSAGELV